MFKEDWKTLNEAQQLAVKCTEKNALVLAPAGTGKTKVIAMRTAYLLSSQVAPEQILCLTFTNKAAKEMTERIRLYNPREEKKLTIKTFHSFCYYLINQEKDSSHFTFPCTILDETDSMEILKKITVSLQNTYAIDYFKLLSFIEEIKKHSMLFPVEEWYQYAKIVSSYLSTQKKKNALFTQYGVKIISTYQKYLKQNNCVDFMDLIMEAKYLLHNTAIAKKWQTRYSYIQVDEMQDTSIREYEVIKLLASENNIALFGDFNQTIYEWRGSNPLVMIDDFKVHFQPIEIYLQTNYRSTQLLLDAANDYIRNSEIFPMHCISHTDIAGEPIYLLIGDSKENEFQKIAQNILARGEEMYAHTAVLCRTNTYAKEISKVFTQHGIPCIQIDDIKLFRRKEVKDILAIFQVMSNPRNSHALEHLLTHPSIHIEEWLLRSLHATKSSYMYLHDWFRMDSSDPYSPLFESAKKGNLVVLDVETTGLDTTKDDIIQIAAIRLQEGRVVDQLDVLVQTNRTVGDSYFVHGFSDEELSIKGIPANEALDKLRNFTRGAVVVGHNIKYDLEIIASSLTRLQAEPLDYTYVYDTLDLAYKLYPSLENHKLDTLAKLFNTPTTPNHNAMQDILATGEVLMHFIGLLQARTNERLQHIEQLYPYILPYKKQLQRQLEELREKTLGEIIPHIMNHWNYKDYYQKEELISLRDFYRIIIQMEEEDVILEENIRRLLTFTSLHYSELEQTPFFRNRIPIMTIHQAKGLEFEHVYVAGCNNKVFPSTRSMKEGYLSEEKRLFYVAMTRAKKCLYLTYHHQMPRSILMEEISEDFKKLMQ